MTLLARGLIWVQFFGVYGNGWTAYTPLTDEPTKSSGLWDAAPSEPIFDDSFTYAALVALVLVVVAAVVEAVWLRSWWLRIVNVIVPALAGWFALWLLAGRPVESLHVTILMVLLAVAVREVWARHSAPKFAAVADE